MFTLPHLEATRYLLLHATLAARLSKRCLASASVLPATDCTRHIVLIFGLAVLPSHPGANLYRIKPVIPLRGATPAYRTL